MDIRIIKKPSPGTLAILNRRKGSNFGLKEGQMDAIGLVQGRLIDMIIAADIAEKTVGVVVEDIRGSCPQNMILLAIYGDTAAVEEALREIKKKIEGGAHTC